MVGFSTPTELGHILIATGPLGNRYAGVVRDTSAANVIADFTSASCVRLSTSQHRPGIERDVPKLHRTGW